MGNGYENYGVQPLKWKIEHFVVAVFIPWIFFVPKEQTTEFVSWKILLSTLILPQKL